MRVVGLASIALLIFTPCIAQAAPPGPAQPMGMIPAFKRVELLLDREDTLSQVFGAHVVITSERIYKEQDGSMTTCDVGRIDGKRLRLISLPDKTPVIQPTPAQWIVAGCTRPNFLFLG
jgi:hypothetical protein